MLSKSNSRSNFNLICFTKFTDGERRRGENGETLIEFISPRHSFQLMIVFKKGKKAAVNRLVYLITNYKQCGSVFISCDRI